MVEVQQDLTDARALPRQQKRHANLDADANMLYMLMFICELRLSALPLASCCGV